MIIQVNLSYNDLKTFIAYTNELTNSFLNDITYSKLKPFVKAQLKCYYCEMFKLSVKLNLKQLNWDITKRKALKRYNFTYTQAYILCFYFDRNTTKHIFINDKIEVFAKQLTT